MVNQITPSQQPGAKVTPALPRVRLSEVVQRIRAFIQEHGYGLHDRLPPERQLAENIAVSRAQLREALASMESNGEIWRHVGKGTFISALDAAQSIGSVTQLVKSTTPMEIMEVRLLLEPKLASLAAIHASEIEIAEIESFLKKGLVTSDIVASQGLGDDLHRAIARAAKNSLLLSMFETIYAVRDATNWGRLKPTRQTEAALALQWEQHTVFVNAIRERDPPAAERAMRQHLEYVVHQMRDFATGAITA